MICSGQVMLDPVTMMVNSFPLSNFKYCLPFFICNIKDLKEMEGLVEWCYRYVFNDFRLNFKELSLKAHYMTLYVNMQRNILRILYHMINNCLASFESNSYKIKKTSAWYENTTVVQTSYRTSKYGFRSLILRCYVI